MSQAQYDEVINAPHKATLSHELLGGAAAFEAVKAYEDHQAKNGKPDSHALAKELFAAFAGAAVDRLIETKGLDAVDSYKAKQHAKQETERLYAERYEN
ncbi:hypothetical protein BC937DRAFT_94163 [Endogone sp. FLAS-F59071]|nr:hypothetical protein BC937DRAFT_94163 [Endogone sp. FLAS-F59071]|eukprot:RUS20869.1 hypothetical protein BC937DRAFT_94163 [Endogone sp. FLAS-F59071]